MGKQEKKRGKKGKILQSRFKQTNKNKYRKKTEKNYIFYQTINFTVKYPQEYY